MAGRHSKMTREDWRRTAAEHIDRVTDFCDTKFTPWLTDSERRRLLITVARFREDVEETTTPPPPLTPSQEREPKDALADYLDDFEG
jgi:hypothetical protein